MTPELKPCPFCGEEPRMGVAYVYGDDNPYARCDSCGVCTGHEAWNRRTPDLTEALARLKALEERMRMGCGEQHQTVLVVPEDYTGEVPFGCECSMADEIAAIRKDLGASAAEPTPAPEP